MNIFKSLSLLVLIICCSCNKPLPMLEGVDTQQWAEDRNACKGLRSQMKMAIDREKKKLLALDQGQMVKLLGRPDRNDLSTRNQKIFFYFLDPSPDCGPGNSSAKKLAIRFNAVGLAKEVAIE